MNVLLITFSFPPAGGVGVLRALSLAKYLPRNGIRVDVLTARNAPAVGRDQSLLAQVPADVTIHRTWTLDLPFALRKAIKRLLSGTKPKPTPTPATADHTPQPSPLLSSRSATGAPGEVPSLGWKAEGPASQPTAPKPGNPLKRLVANLLLPDPQIGWLPFALPAARRLIRSRGIDAVLITVPPFSSAKLVTGLRRAFPALPILLDFRDEWLSTTIDLVSFNNNARAREIAHRTEREAVHAATRVVLVTEAARAELIRRYPNEPATKFLCIHNGFDRPLPTHGSEFPTATASPLLSSRSEAKGPASSPTQPLSSRPERSAVEGPASLPAAAATLTYIGTVYGSTDPSTLVAAIHSLPPHLQHRLRLRFIGHIETEALRQTLLSLPPGILELRGFLPQAEALAAINSTDWLLLVTRDRINVAAKFYDYLGGGKPILAAVHPEGDVRRLLDQTHAGLAADVFSPESIAALLTRVLDPTGADHVSPATIQPDRAAIARFHRSALTALYAEALRQAAAR